MTNDLTVRRDDARSAYVLELDGQPVGVAAYVKNNNRLIFTHTEIEDAYEGRHLGSELITAALDDVRERHETALAQCPFVAAFVSHHPEYQDFVDLPD